MNTQEKVNYGLKLKSFREKLNLTQEEVVSRARKFVEECNKDEDSDYKTTCFNQNQLSNWEKGKYIPHHINRHLLSVIYNVPMEELDINYPKNEDEELEEYINRLLKENDTYINVDDMAFESEEEIKEVIGDSYNHEYKDAFNNGIHVKVNYLTKLHLNNNWSIEKKTQFLIDLHIAHGLPVPNQLIELLNEKDIDKKNQMYYQYYINFYNGALYASKKKK